MAFFEEFIKWVKEEAVTSERVKDALGRARACLDAFDSTYYQLLGVENNADLEFIKEAYKKYALVFHPDKLAGRDDKDLLKQNGEDIFKLIQEAYEVLSDNTRRAEYDSNFSRVQEPVAAEFYATQQAQSSFFDDVKSSNQSSRAATPDTEVRGRHGFAKPSASASTRSKSSSGRSTPDTQPRGQGPSANSNMHSSAGQRTAARSKSSSGRSTPSDQMAKQKDLDSQAGLIKVFSISSFLDVSFTDLSGDVCLDVLSKAAAPSFKTRDEISRVSSGRCPQLYSPKELISKIESEYLELRSQTCCVGLFDRFRSNFFDGAYQYAVENLEINKARDELSDAQKLWIVLKYEAEGKKGSYTRTREAVKNVLHDICSRFSEASQSAVR